MDQCVIKSQRQRPRHDIAATTTATTSSTSSTTTPSTASTTTSNILLKTTSKTFRLATANHEVDHLLRVKS